MKYVLTLLFIVFTFSALSQRKVIGAVFEEFNSGKMPFVKVQEVGTDNYVETDINGTFQITTLSDTCILKISFIGFEDKEIIITQDAVLVVIFNYPDYSTKWVTSGIMFDAINIVFGLELSNGYNERLLIHFEDFSEKFIYKVSGYTDLKKDYSFGTAIAWRYLFKWLSLVSVEYKQTDYTNVGYFCRDVTIAANKYLRLFRSELFLKAGYQNLNKNYNWGVLLGIQNVFIRSRLYAGVSIGYYCDYLNYSAYLQSFIYKNKISLGLIYDKISDFDFFKIGLNFTFSR